MNQAIILLFSPPSFWAAPLHFLSLSINKKKMQHGFAESHTKWPEDASSHFRHRPFTITSMDTCEACGKMDNASASGAEDCGFKSHQACMVPNDFMNFFFSKRRTLEKTTHGVMLLWRQAKECKQCQTFCFEFSVPTEGWAKE